MAEDDAAETAAARALAVDGLKLADAGKCAEAIDKLQRAEKLHHGPIVLGRLGECQVSQRAESSTGRRTCQGLARGPPSPIRPPPSVKARERAQTALDAAALHAAGEVVTIAASRPTETSTITWTGSVHRIADTIADNPSTSSKRRRSRLPQGVGTGVAEAWRKGSRDLEARGGPELRAAERRRRDARARRERERRPTAARRAAGRDSGKRRIAGHVLGRSKPIGGIHLVGLWWSCDRSRRRLRHHCHQRQKQSREQVPCRTSARSVTTGAQLGQDGGHDLDGDFRRGCRGLVARHRFSFTSGRTERRSAHARAEPRAVPRAWVGLGQRRLRHGFLRAVDTLARGDGVGAWRGATCSRWPLFRPWPRLSPRRTRRRAAPRMRLVVKYQPLGESRAFQRLLASVRSRSTPASCVVTEALPEFVGRRAPVLLHRARGRVARIRCVRRRHRLGGGVRARRLDRRSFERVSRPTSCAASSCPAPPRRCIVEGRTFAVPWYGDVGVLFYRRDLVDHARRARTRSSSERGPRCDAAPLRHPGLRVAGPPVRGARLQRLRGHLGSWRARRWRTRACCSTRAEARAALAYLRGLARARHSRRASVTSGGRRGVAPRVPGRARGVHAQLAVRLGRGPAAGSPVRGQGRRRAAAHAATARRATARSAATSSPQCATSPEQARGGVRARRAPDVARSEPRPRPRLRAQPAAARDVRDPRLVAGAPVHREALPMVEHARPRPEDAVLRDDLGHAAGRVLRRRDRHPLTRGALCSAPRRSSITSRARPR